MELRDIDLKLFSEASHAEYTLYGVLGSNFFCVGSYHAGHRDDAVLRADADIARIEARIER